MRLIRHLVKRLLTLIPMLLGITVVTFFLLRLIPGDPASALAGDNASPDLIAAIRREMGLDEPIWTQYTIYLGRLVRGDLGTSWFTRRPVWNEFMSRVPATLELALSSYVLGIGLGVLGGVIAALRKGRPADHAVGAVAVLGISIPPFWLGLILIFVLFVQLGWVAAPLGRLDVHVDPPDPVTGSYVVDALLTGNQEAFSSALGHLVLPVVTLALLVFGPVQKQTRSALLDVLGSDFVRYARACGLPERQVWAYALHNAAIPVLTRAGIIFSHLLGGAALIEFVFAWGGLGQYGLTAAINRDFFPIQGFVLLNAIFAALVYLMLDLLYAAVDPRIEY